MKTAVVMMVLLGCDCDGVACEYVRTVSSGWQSVETCQAAIDRQIAVEHASYPLVAAHCEAQMPGNAPDPGARPASEALVAAVANPDASAGNNVRPFTAVRIQATEMVAVSLASVKVTTAWAGNWVAGGLVRRLSRL